MSAVLSVCGTYRYRLDRAVEPLTGAGRVLVCMLNPSKADAENDDPTIRKLRGFCSRMDPVPFGFTVVNAFAFRATALRCVALGEYVVRFGLRVKTLSVPVPWLRLDHESSCESAGD